MNLASVTKNFFFVAIILLCSGFVSPIIAQEDSEDIEVYLSFRHRGVINTVVISYYKDDRFFLPITELFSLFQIEAKQTGLVTTGRFSSEQIPYSIDLGRQFIKFGDQTFELTTDDFLVKELDNYLPPNIYKDLFGLEFTIDFNNLTLDLETNTELPLIQKRLREQKRKLVDSNLKEQTFYPLRKGKTWSLLNGGAVDYSLTSYNSNQASTYNFNTSIGLQLAGGDLEGSIFGRYTNDELITDTDNLRWRYIFRNNRYLTKVTAGQTNMDGVLMNPYTGIRITNEPIENRRLFDEFEIRGSTFPQSEVEVYLNNALIDYAEADEMGNYRFLAPLYYGSSQLNLKIYGPTGQIIERSNRIQVPFSFTPKGELNYIINAGILENPLFGSTEKPLAAQGNISYGVTNWLTAKIGSEYYDEGLEKDAPVFTSTLSARLNSNYILTLEGVTDAYYRGNLNAVFANAASFNLDYTNYINDFGIFNSSGNTKQLITSVFYPILIQNIPLNIRWSTFTRYRPESQTTSLRFDLSTRLRKFNIRMGYSDRLVDTYNPIEASQTSSIESSVTYNVSRNPNLPAIIRGTFLRTQLIYLPKLNEVESAQFLLSRSIFQTGRIQFSYGRNFFSNFNAFRFSLVLDFNKARSNTTFSSLKDNTSITKNIRGSVGYDTNYNNFLISSRNQVGRSGAAIKLFVDNDNNGRFDKEIDDPIEEGSVRIGRSGSSSIRKNGILYYTQIQPYYQYNMVMNKSSIKNPMLVPEEEEFSIITDPNTFKKIELPFYMSGVIEGVVERLYSDGQRGGLGGLKLNLVAKNRDFTQELRTFSDGSFYAYEIPPGEYEIAIDGGQLEILKANAKPRILNFEVQAIADGDFVEGLNFLVIPEGLEELVEPDTVLSTSIGNAPETTPSNVTSTTFNYSIAVESLTLNECRYGLQLGAYSTLNKAVELSMSAKSIDAYVLYNAERNLYAIRSGLYQNLSLASDYAIKASNSVFPDVSVVNQCYGNVASSFIPGKSLYYLQFGAFSSKERSQNFDRLLNERYGISSIITQDPNDNLFKVKLGPFTTSLEAVKERAIYLKNPIVNDIYISKEDAIEFVTVDFEYRLLFGEFDNIDNAILYAKQLSNSFQVTAKVVIDERESITLVTDQNMTDWDKVLKLRDELRKNVTFRTPVIQLIEKVVQ